MSLPGADELLKDVPAGWRRAAYAAMLAAFVVASYFIFVSGRIADAMELAQHSEKRIDKVEGDIAQIKDGVGEIRERQAARDQTIADLKESVAAINRKLDALLIQNGRRAQAYP